MNIFKKTIFTSTIHQEEALERLQDVVQDTRPHPMKVFMGDSSHKPYSGRIEGHIFIIKRIIGYRNHFLPEIKGVITPDGSNINIELSVKPNPVALIFIGFFFVFACIASLVSIYIIVTSEVFEPLTLIPFGMLGVVALMVILGVGIEANVAKRFIKNLFNASVKKE